MHPHEVPSRATTCAKTRTCNNGLSTTGPLRRMPSVLLGAIAMVHWGQQWRFATSESRPMGGMEFQAVLLLVGLYFALRGNDA